MLIVALDLGWAAEMALHENRIGIAAQRVRGGVVHGPAGNHIFRLANIGNDDFVGKLYAASHAG